MTTIHEASYQRNGISGVGFHQAIVSGVGDYPGKRFLVIVYEDDDGGQAEYTAAISLDDDGRPEMDQAWRGDHFADQFNKPIREFVSDQFDRQFGMGKYAK